MTILAVDIGGTKIAAARVRDDGEVDGSVATAATPADQGPMSLIGAVVRVLESLESSDVDLLAVASAGVIDTDTGTVRAATSSISDWIGFPLRDRLQNVTGWRTVVLGDGQAHGIGEAHYGTGRGHRSVVVLAVGTGIGGAFLQDGRPLLGAHHAGGHFGHLPVPQAVGMDCFCGSTGHLEAIGSGAGVLQQYRVRSGNHSVTTTREVFDRAGTDAAAAAVVHQSGAAVGTAAAGLVNAFDPEIVIVTGGVARTDDAWAVSLHAAYAQGVMPYLAATPVVITQSHGLTALQGVAHHARVSCGTT